MRGASVHFDLRGQVCPGERLFQSVLIVGQPRIVICGDAEDALGVREILLASGIELAQVAGTRKVKRLGGHLKNG